MSVGNMLSISRISVEKLFGMYDYSLSIPRDRGENNKILILYGDNGSGKTSILKIAFNLLAPDDKKGLKSKVTPIPFRKFVIELSDRTEITAERDEQSLIGSYNMRIKRPKKKAYEFSFIADKDLRIRIEDEIKLKQVKLFLDELWKLDLGLYFLTDDRQINLAGRQQEDDSSSVEDRFSFFSPYLEREAITAITAINAREAFTPEIIAQHLLRQSIDRVEEWIRSRAIIGSSRGESSVNALYNDILKRLVALPQDQRIDTTSTKKSIENRVSTLESNSGKFAEYGLMPKLQGQEILSAVRKTKGDSLGIIAHVLNPYLESIEKKLEALNDLFKKVDSLVTIVNRFLTNKALTFDLRSGLKVITDDGAKLDPLLLSSGERHLFLLFFNSIIAVDRPSIMMIDEPEISLNVKWQRMLLSSILECIGDSPVQYIFATHSIELLAKHKSRVLKLEHIRES